MVCGSPRAGGYDHIRGIRPRGGQFFGNFQVRSTLAALRSVPRRAAWTASWATTLSLPAASCRWCVTAVSLAARGCSISAWCY